MILIISILLLYGIYFEASGWFSAFDKGNGYDKCELILKDLRKIDTGAIFAKNGMTLRKTVVYWRGKTVSMNFYITENTCDSIPLEIEEFILKHKNVVGSSRIELVIRNTPQGKEFNHWDTTILLEKMYFWWRLFY